jgi:tetratricopeptide (TPR) repeat protein
VRAALKSFGLVIALASSAVALACINETGTNRLGKPVPVDTPLGYLRAGLEGTRSERERIDWAEKVTAQSRRVRDFATLNELAVVLIHFGRAREAVVLLEVLEKRYPDSYEVATNLGTAYELLGDNERALRWIREGVLRNPDSHEGSEWIHIRILEAKRARKERDPSLLALDFGREDMPRLPAGNAGTAPSPADLSRDVFLQLAERTQFVRPRDAVVAGLLFDWGNLEMATGTLEVADLAYEFALEYGHAERALIERRRLRIAQILDAAKG